MEQTITIEEALKRDSDFLERIGKNHWVTEVVDLETGEKHCFNKADIKMLSPFGEVRLEVVVDRDGKPLFSRPGYAEAPNANMMVYGFDKDGTMKIASISEYRPHATNPIRKESRKALMFDQIPMGFAKVIFGEGELYKFESTENAGVRETMEETGAQIIRKVTRPSFPYFNPAPSFVKTWSDVYFIEVDLNNLGNRVNHGDEKIFKCEFITVTEHIKRVRGGIVKIGEKEAIARYGNALGVAHMFFCTFPEHFVA